MTFLLSHVTGEDCYAVRCLSVCEIVKYCLMSVGGLTDVCLALPRPGEICLALSSWREQLGGRICVCWQGLSRKHLERGCGPLVFVSK